MSTSEIATLRLERRFRASPEEVFDAWTNPEVLQRWWAMRPAWTSPGCEIDLRVGGRYLLRMRDDGLRAVPRRSRGRLERHVRQPDPSRLSRPRRALTPITHHHRRFRR